MLYVFNKASLMTLVNVTHPGGDKYFIRNNVYVQDVAQENIYQLSLLNHNVNSKFKCSLHMHR